MNWPTLLIAGLVAAAFAAIIVSGVRKKKHGKSSCACGSCAACGACGQSGKETGKTDV